MPAFGLTEHPSEHIDEAIAEVRTEIEARRRRGSKVEMPSGEGLRRAVEQKLREKFGSDSISLGGKATSIVDFRTNQGMTNGQAKLSTEDKKAI